MQRTPIHEVDYSFDPTPMFESGTVKVAKPEPEKPVHPSEAAKAQAVVTEWAAGSTAEDRMDALREAHKPQSPFWQK